MPVMKVANKKGTHQNDNARSLLYDYIMQPNKIPHQLVGRESVGANVVEEMNQTAQQFNKDSRIRVRHFMVSYTPFDTTDPTVVDAIAREVAAYLGQRYQVAYAVHEDTENLHFHIMFNAVSYVDGYKYHGDKAEHFQLLDAINAANHRYGIYSIKYVSTLSDEDIQ